MWVGTIPERVGIARTGFCVRGAQHRSAVRNVQKTAQDFEIETLWAVIDRPLQRAAFTRYRQSFFGVHVGAREMKFDAIEDLPECR